MFSEFIQIRNVFDVNFNLVEEKSLYQLNTFFSKPQHMYLARVQILQQQSECAAGDLSVAKRHHGAVPPLALEHGAEVGGARAQQEPVVELQTKVREDYTIEEKVPTKAFSYHY